MLLKLDLTKLKHAPGSFASAFFHIVHQKTNIPALKHIRFRGISNNLVANFLDNVSVKELRRSVGIC